MFFPPYFGFVFFNLNYFLLALLSDYQFNRVAKHFHQMAETITTVCVYRVSSFADDKKSFDLLVYILIRKTIRQKKKQQKKKKKKSNQTKQK